MSASAREFEQVLTRRSSAALSQGIVAGLVGLLDAVSVLAGAIIAFVMSQSSHVGAASPPLILVALAAAVLILVFSAAGLYRFPVIMRPASSVAMMAVLAVSVGIALIALGYALDVHTTGLPRASMLGWLCTTVGFVVVLRFLMATSMMSLARAGRIARRIMIYGAGPQGERLVQRIAALDEPWNRIVGVFDDRRTRIVDVVSGVRVDGGLDDLLLRGRRERPDEVLVALPWGAEERILEILHRLAVLPANIRLAPEFHRMDQIQGRTNSQFGLPMLNAYEKPVDGWGRIWKRLFDFALGGVGVVVAAPLLLLIAVLIRIESPGPVLFRQPRYGFNNKLIEVYKFRTMRSDASDRLGNRLTERGDDRVTRVGVLLRRTSLDELPQLINVLKSEMSLVGPRPHAVRTTAGGKLCDEVVDQYAVRHKVKPGITGWAQVNGWRGTMETEEHLVKRLEHDLYYINNWSPLFDLKILIMTVWSVLSGRNSF
jgi:Undecaprenyl-phosphate glucose phosphotransferase